MSMPSIPTTFTHNLKPQDIFDIESKIEGGLDTNLSGNFTATHAGAIETKVSGKLETDNVLKLTGDPKAPVSTDSKIEILNLPRFTLEDIKDLMKVRVRIPNYSNVCLKVLGVELMSVCMGGESQVITEPYRPNTAEQCLTDECCAPDTRPFPEGKPQRKASAKKR
tara:strand:+ start:182 stop:679 length:498 start_codon:yes stop_codon:yes gene_type:complete